MRWGLALALALAGCNILAGYKGLTLRDAAVCAWSDAVGDKGPKEVRAVGVAGDAAIVAGTFGGALQLGAAKLTAAGSEDGFVAVLGADGSVRYALSLGVPGQTDYARPLAASHDVVAGYYSGRLANLEQPGPGLFLLEVDPASGNASLQGFSGQGFGSADKLALVVDPDGNLVVGGGYTGALDLGTGCSFAATTNQRLFLAKLNRQFGCAWAVRNAAATADTAPETIESIASDDYKDLVVAGEAVGPLAFSKDAPLQGSGGIDFFVARFDSDGHPQWSKRFGGGGLQSSARVAAAPLGSVALAGYFSQQLNLGGGVTMQSSGGADDHDICVVKLTPGGDIDWKKQLVLGRADPKCVPKNCQLDKLDIAFDTHQHLIIAGAFRGAIDIDDVTLTSANGDSDFFLASFDESGNLLWTGRFGDGNDQCREPDCRVALATDGSDNILLGGYFENSVDFGKGLLNSGADRVGFVAKFLP